MNDEDFSEMVVYWMILIGIVFVASLVGLTMAIMKGIFLLFGIETNL